MNVVGSGFITIIVYAATNGSAIQNALLTEAASEILAENSDYLQIETA